MELPKFKKNKRNEKETKFEIEEYNSSDTFEETKVNNWILVLGRGD